MQVGSKTSVKLPRSHCKFANLVFHGCTTLPNPLPRNYSLSASIGYQNLVDQRNTKQAEELQELQDQYVESHVPDIFKHIVDQQIANERARAQLKGSKQSPETLVLFIEDDEEAPWTLELVKPLNSRDELAVKLDKDVINNVIKYLQHAGFSSDLQEVNKKRKGMSSDSMSLRLVLLEMWCLSKVLVVMHMWLHRCGSMCLYKARQSLFYLVGP